MRVNLSVEKIAGALAALGTSALIAACGGAEQPKTPVTSTEVPATDKASGEASGHCGAEKTHAGGQAGCGATHADPAKAATDAVPAKTDTSAPATPSTDTAKTDATKAATDVSKTPAPSTTGTATKKAPAAPVTPPAGGTKKTGGAASCGAGTCSAKK